MPCVSCFILKPRLVSLDVHHLCLVVCPPLIDCLPRCFNSPGPGPIVPRSHFLRSFSFLQRKESKRSPDGWEQWQNIKSAKARLIPAVSIHWLTLCKCLGHTLYQHDELKLSRPAVWIYSSKRFYCVCSLQRRWQQWSWVATSQPPVRCARALSLLSSAAFWHLRLAASSLAHCSGTLHCNQANPATGSLGLFNLGSHASWPNNCESLTVILPVRWGHDKTPAPGWDCSKSINQSISLRSDCSVQVNEWCEAFRP